MNSRSLVSIILPVYNGEDYLQSAIDSCLQQSHEHIELIIVNDCSTDDSLKIAEHNAKLDVRVTVINNLENKQLPASLNIGHENAKGVYYTWTSHDNILLEDCIVSLVQVLETEKADVVFSNYQLIDADNNVLRTHISGPKEHLIFGNKIGASFLYKKQVFEELKGYDESLFLLEDFDFWLRASGIFRFYHLNSVLYQYRIHSNSLTSELSENNTVSGNHILKAEQMYERLSIRSKWSVHTKKLVLNNFSGEVLLVNNYLKYKKIILKDLYAHFSNHFEKKMIKQSLFIVLRKHLISNENNHNLRVFIQVLLREMALLFHADFSKKVTLKYIRKALFR